MQTAFVIDFISTLAGLAILALRLWPVFRHGGMCLDRNGPVRLGRNERVRLDRREDDDLVSVVIPARNEQANLPRLLASLMRSSWKRLEIIVVDDESTDRTRGLALEAGETIRRERPDWRFELVDGRPRPASWTGKNWACHQGWLEAKGQWILFTDADTAHDRESLARAIPRMKSQKLDLLSAVPYHRCETVWEKLMGPFHVLILASTAAFGKPRIGRIFAIGQFMLFQRAAYERQGGHKRIRETLADDLELAHECLKAGGKYAVESGARFFDVRMYDSFGAFFRGWRRIIRLGIRHASVVSVVESYFMIAVLTAGLQFAWAPPARVLAMLLAVVGLGVVQKRFGSFSIWGLLTLPFSVGVFVFVSLFAAVDLLTKRSYSWRGRSYAPSPEL